MSIRSDVGIVMSRKLHDEVLKKSSQDFLDLLKSADEHKRDTDEILYVFNYIKFYIEYDKIEYDKYDLVKLFKILKGKEDEFYIVEIINDTMEVKTYGNMVENNFNLGYTLQLYYE